MEPFDNYRNEFMGNAHRQRRAHRADVRVNLVAPDAVFFEGNRKSGLWQEVGPDRMAVASGAQRTRG